MKHISFLIFLLFFTVFVFAKKEYTGKVVDDTVFIDSEYSFAFSVSDSQVISPFQKRKKEPKKKDKPPDLKSLKGGWSALRYYSYVYGKLYWEYDAIPRALIFSEGISSYGKMKQPNIIISVYILEKPDTLESMKYKIEEILESNKTNWSSFYYTSSGKIEDLSEPNFYLQYKALRKTLDVEDGEVVNFNCYFDWFIICQKIEDLTVLWVAEAKENKDNAYWKSLLEMAKSLKIVKEEI